MSNLQSFILLPSVPLTVRYCMFKTIIPAESKTPPLLPKLSYIRGSTVHKECVFAKGSIFLQPYFHFCESLKQKKLVYESTSLPKGVSTFHVFHRNSFIVANAASA
ncbi:predicted protein [Sclerotinia sclerotiorum 1980 UF-70]|uniref:Uncharacterized protein n=1 Tax=Sclerotinia sclerotiorum (strain ATCC 18683 / 1980 / Ss-1) TaxID=665079 RepID=A7EJZ0_SCLS1|nr:predicted protein [Sclerotinia sclerotiorum 1980 UF-70]EDO03156.1 predicted protein [Sclerotinia sclerotiorum 1980 UF-70]